MGEICLLEVPFCEHAMRGSPRPHPALLVSSNTKWAYAVTTGRYTVRIFKGSGGEHRLVEVPFCECARRGSKRPHLALLLVSNTKWAYAVTVDKLILRISEGPWVKFAYRRSHFANTQCEAVRGRIPVC